MKDEKNREVSRIPFISRAQVIYAVVVLFIGIAIIAIILDRKIGEKEVASALLAMVGTFLGALFAFRLNENKEIAKLDKERIAAINRALFILVRQYNAILSFQKDLVNHNTLLEIAFNLPAIQLPLYQDLVIEYESLVFLVEFGNPDIF